MDTAVAAIFFGVLGTALGSFANAVALRYDPDRFLFAPATGRSHCPSCRHKLSALELVPVISWVALRGRCRSCRERISWRYPGVEVLTGLACAAVPLGLVATSAHFLEPWRLAVAAACWVGIVLFLVIIALVDLKHFVIPDEANAAVAGLGILAGFATAPAFSEATGSFLGSYAMLAGFHADPLLARLLGAAAAGGLLFFLFAVTRGRGIGFGDVKLALALGVAFAWPDSLVIVALAFILGTFAAVPGLLAGKLRGKSSVPFGPFLALAALVVLAFGDNLARAYFGILLL